MAFTDAEKVKIRYYLGWGDRFQQSDSGLETAIGAVELNAATVTFIQDTLLTDLDAVYASLKDAHGRLKAAKVGSIDLPMQNEIMMLRSEGRRLAQSLGSTFGVPTRHDVFSGGRNMSFVEFGGSRVGGGYYPQG